VKGNFLFAVSPSGKRGVLTGRFQLSPAFSLTATGAVKISGISNSEFFPASFRIETGNKVIYIDPFEIGDPVPADYIFITHAHPDHLSILDIKKIAKKGTLIICPHTAVKKLSGYTVMEVIPGDVLDLGNFKCEAVASYNLKPVLLWLYLHPKTDRNVGYILNLDGVRIYHAGDTDYIPEMRKITNITVALVPIGAGKTAMNPVQAASLINEMKPATAVPMHFELGKNQAHEFKDLVDKSVKVAVLTAE
jgi:L-ascorbate metabolism protein UlaG (beta-lactamase superfamily)